jgi:hypothetical protein
MKSKNLKCFKCNYGWKSIKKKPKLCPRCHSPNWNRKSMKSFVDFILK